MSLGLAVIKAVGNRCNLRCRYCYALSEIRQNFMSDRTLKRVIKAISELAPLPIFFWGGGEPLLRGKDFFKKVLDLQSRFCGNHNVINSLQTNGTLLDVEWIDLFRQYNFQIGISWDGRNDSSRVTLNGEAISDNVWGRIELCLKEGLNPGIIMVITRQNKRFVSETARLLYLRGIKNLLLKPYIGGIEELSLDSASYAEVVCRLLDLWLDIGDKNWIIEPLHSYMKVLSGNFSGVACQLTNNCGNFLTIESNGDISCCDFIPQRLVFENVHTSSIHDVLEKSHYRRFMETAKIKPEGCFNCGWVPLCGGGCLHYREFNSRFQQWERYSLCKATKKIFDYCSKHLRKT